MNKAEKDQENLSRTQAKEALNPSNTFLNNIINATGEPIFVKDEGSKFVFVNDALCVMLGITRENIIGKTLGESLPKDQMDHFLKVDKEVLDSGIESQCEELLTGKQGKIRTIVTKKTRYVNEHGEKYLIGVIHDITEQAEEKIREKDIRFRKLSAHVPDMIFQFTRRPDGSYCVPVASEGIKNIFGCTPEDVLDDFTPISRVIYPEDAARVSSDIEYSAKHLTFFTCEFRVHIPGNAMQWIFSKAAPEKLADGSITWFGFNADITERKNAEEMLRNYQKLESLGVLAGGIAHDFNNLLAGIFGYIDLARSVSQDGQVKEYLTASLASMNRARALTLQLLTFAKGGAPAQKTTPLIPFIQETVNFALSGSNMTCRFSLPENLRLCNIDKNQIGQVIDNIVINAKQAMPNGGTIEIAAENISLGKKEHPTLVKGMYVKVSIKDSGIGIPKDVVPRIFDPFYTTKTQGHGLGLATCYSIIKRHGGAIDVESEPGKGSAFHVYLPASLEAVPAETTGVSWHNGTGTILVMDDEEAIRNSTRKMLEMMGYDVVCRNDGKAALDFYVSETSAGHTFTAMLFDLTIPGGMGGIEAVAEVRKRDREIPVMVLSGYSDDSVMKNPGKYGFTASLSKPFTIAELSEMLENSLKAKK